MWRKGLMVGSAAALAALTGCVAPVGPVEVTRFHVLETAVLGRGPIAVVPAPGMLGDSLELTTYEAAVSRELTRLGYGAAPAGTAGQIAQVSLRRERYRPERARGPVSVGVGGETGSWGSGVGLGLGIDLSGRPPDQVETELRVVIKDRASAANLWEGRAYFVAPANSALGQVGPGSTKMAQALFRDFPGRSGETIEVR